VIIPDHMNDRHGQPRNKNVPDSGRREENVVVRTSKAAALVWRTNVSDVAKNPHLDSALYERHSNC
jgi:hypothetical protein